MPRHPACSAATRRAALAGLFLAALAAGACRRNDTVPAGRAEPTPSPAAGDLPPGRPPVGDAPPAAEGAAAAVTGTLSLSPELRGRESKAAAIYLIARGAQSGQIVAVRREAAGTLPRPFRISGADAMVAGTAFAGPLDVTARLSRSGDAMPGPGDVEGTVKGVAVGATGVAVVLDTVRQ